MSFPWLIRTPKDTERIGSRQTLVVALGANTFVRLSFPDPLELGPGDGEALRTLENLTQAGTRP